MTVIRDPKEGIGMEVNDEGQGVVRAIIEPELEHASGRLGTAYTWDSTTLNIDAGDTMLFVKNTGDVPLILDKLVLNGSNVICTWEIGIGALQTTPAGTTVTAVNMNEVFSSKTPDAVSFSDETAIADASVSFRFITPVTDTKVFDMTGLILGKNHYVQINQETASTSGSAILVGHFEAPS